MTFLAERSASFGVVVAKSSGFFISFLSDDWFV